MTPALLFMGDHPATLVADDLRTRKLPFEFSTRMEGFTARSALFVPMLAGADVIGMVTAARLQPRALGMMNARTLNVLAGQAAIALENARLYAVEHRRATRSRSSATSGCRRLAQISRSWTNCSPKSFMKFNSVLAIPTSTFWSNKKTVICCSLRAHIPSVNNGSEHGEHMQYHEGIIGWVAAHAEPLVVLTSQRRPLRPRS